MARYLNGPIAQCRGLGDGTCRGLISASLSMDWGKEAAIGSAFTSDLASATSSMRTSAQAQGGRTEPRGTKTRCASAAHRGAWPCRIQPKSWETPSLTCSSVSKAVALTTAMLKSGMFKHLSNTLPNEAPAQLAHHSQCFFRRPRHPLNCLWDLAIEFNTHSGESEDPSFRSANHYPSG